MKTTVKDIFRIKGENRIYGYCECGREVKHLKDYKCPCCGAELIWKMPEKIKEI